MTKSTSQLTKAGYDASQISSMVYASTSNTPAGTTTKPDGTTTITAGMYNHNNNQISLNLAASEANESNTFGHEFAHAMQTLVSGSTTEAYAEYAGAGTQFNYDLEAFMAGIDTDGDDSQTNNQDYFSTTNASYLKTNNTMANSYEEGDVDKATIQYRPLRGSGKYFYPFAGPLGRVLELSPEHAQIFFDDGENAGYFNDGQVKWNTEVASDYNINDILSPITFHYDDNIMKEATKRVESRYEADGISRYSVCGNNCQDFIGDVIQTYNSLGGSAPTLILSKPYADWLK